MLWLGAETVRHCGDFAVLVPAIQAMNRDGTDQVERLLLSQKLQDGGQNDWLMLPAWRFDRCFGVKIANVFPGNAARNLASVQGAYLLFDGQTGQTLCGMDGAMLTLRKTAANSAAAAAWLARKDAAVLCMIGAGALAPHLVEAHCAVRPIRKVLWWNRSQPPLRHAIELTQRLLPDVEVQAVLELGKAVAEADIISCATMAVDPVLRGAWLKRGAHIDLVGSYRPDMREADDACVLRAVRHYVDARFTTLEVAGDLTKPIAAGLLDPRNVIDLQQVARDEKPKRLNDEEITWFKSGGGGHEDLATAWAVYQAYRGELTEAL
jgi:ornithine cyclodeaminase